MEDWPGTPARAHGGEGDPLPFPDPGDARTAEIDRISGGLLDDGPPGFHTGTVGPGPTATRPPAEPGPDATAAVAEPPPEPAEPAREPVAHRRSGRRIALRAAQVLLTLLSVVVLGATGYAWATLQHAQNGMATADVLDSKAASVGAPPPDGSMDILLVGMDSRTDAKGNPLPGDQLAQLHAGENTGELNTDTMILIHIPTGGGTATGLSIPRDSWVSIPGYGHGKINSAYGLAKNTALTQLKAQGVTDPAQLDVQSGQAGAKEAIHTVEQLTGVGIDHYAAINLMGFDQISNAIGGVPVCLNHAVNDTQWSGARFPAGDFSVQGLQALEFVRQRHNIPGGSTDLQREKRQQAFLASMAHKILSQGVLTNPGTLNSLIDAIQGAITIDNHWNLVDFAQQMSGMSSGRFSFQTIPVLNIDYHVGGTDAVEVDPAEVSAFVHGVTGAPTRSGGGPTTDVAGTQSAPASSGVAVDLRNASGVAGLAGKVQGVLTARGYGQGSTTTSATRASSIIYYPTGREADAQAVADSLGGNFTLAEGTSVSGGHVLVYLGRHYSGPTKATGATGSTGPSAPAGSAAPSTPPPGSAPIVDSGSGTPCVD